MSAEAQMSLAPTKLNNFPQAVPDSAGIPQSVRDEMLVAPFNDLDFIRSLLAEQGDQIAGLIVEPLQRVVPPKEGFLQALREECAKYGIVLIFDEIVTGFRFAYGGAQELYGVTPDVCTLGKIIGGGFALAAIAGRTDIMAHFDKSQVGAEGFLMQLGTLSGNPVAAVAGLKIMEILSRPGAYEKIRENGQTLMDALTRELSKAGHAHQIVGDPTLFDVAARTRHLQIAGQALSVTGTDRRRSGPDRRGNCRSGGAARRLILSGKRPLRRKRCALSSPDCGLTPVQTPQQHLPIAAYGRSAV